jgi:exodeoxyribonuclease V alpha subunit
MAPTKATSTLGRILARSDAPRYLLPKIAAAHGGTAKGVDALNLDAYDVLRNAGATLDVADRVADTLKLSLDQRALGHAEWALCSRTMIAMSMLCAKVRFALEISEATTYKMLKKLVSAGNLIEMQGQVVSATHYAKNVFIARDISRRSIRLPEPNAGLAESFATITNVTPEQRAALDAAIFSRISIITGGPGTGKSHVVREMVAAFPYTKVTAPTGRAARNASGKTVHYFKTIQESGKNDFAGIGLIIVDEASMLSTELMNSVLEMAPDNAHIVLVGDVDQLPPIDAGNVLHDLIAYGSWHPVTRLLANHRSATGIQTFAAGILEGKVALGPGINIVPCDSFNDVVNALPGRTVGDWIVLTPHNVTRVKLNKALQLYLADDELEITLAKDFPDAPRGTRGVASYSGNGVTVLADNGVSFQSTLAAAGDLIDVDTRAGGMRAESGLVLLPGNKIIVTKNTPDVCNGDIGTFESFGMARIDDATVAIPAVSESDPGMTLAYAVTVHKAQGSEFDTVIVPVTNVQAWDRALLYTAITRAKTQVYLLGSQEDIETIIGTIRPARPSILRDLLN